jgi:hypothetical protein
VEAGVKLDAFGRFDPYSILSLSGAKAYGKLENAHNAIKASANDGKGGGLIVAIQEKRPFLDNSRNPLDGRQINGTPGSEIINPGAGSGNYATYLGRESKPFWEWATTGWSHPGAAVKHKPNLPGGYSYVLYVVIPATVARYRSPTPSRPTD